MIWALRLLAALVILGAIYTEYRPALNGAFVYEDERWNIACQDGNGSLFGARGLMRESWCQQQGQSAQSYHLVNLGLHLLVGVMLWGLLTSLNIAEPVRWAVTGLWLIHPLNQESVAYLSGRSELIGAIGVLGCAFFALRRSWLLAGLMLGIGFGGKDSAVLALALVPLLFMVRSGRWRHVAVGMTTVLVAIGIAGGLGHNWSEASRADLWLWPLTQSMAFTRLLGMSLIPLGQTIDYDYGVIPFALQALGVIVVALTVTAAWMARGQRLLVAGFAWLLCAVLPRFLVVTPLSPLNEHQFYLPMIGLAFIGAHIGQSCLQESPTWR